MLWMCFANDFLQTFSERENDAQHRIALYSTKRIFCVVFHLICFMLFCEKRKKNKPHTKHRKTHHKTPQNTAKH